MTLAVAILAGLVAFEYLFSLLMLGRPREIRVVTYQGQGSHRTCLVLPGFSNPPDHLGQGMQRILGEYGPMLMLHHSTTVSFDLIYAAIMAKLDELKAKGAPGELAVYGHSMGGQLGSQFCSRYEQEGDPYGPIRELFLDCSPGSIHSLPGPMWLKRAFRSALRFYRGGPLLALIVAFGNYISRFTMPAPRAEEVDAVLYSHYARGLMWFNNRAWVAQMRYMLSYQPPTTPIATNARVVYIGATDPSRDGLVRQRVSIPEWQRAYPGLTVIRDPSVGHAWPMEQPEAYARIVRSVLVGTSQS